MVALLVGMAILAIFMSMAMPVWRQANQREKEAELIWRGQQYDRAIADATEMLPADAAAPAG